MTNAGMTGEEVTTLSTQVPSARKAELLNIAQQSVRRVKRKGLTVGTAARIGPDIFVTAAHVVSEHGKLLESTVDNHVLKLEFSVPSMDIAVLRGQLVQFAATLSLCRQQLSLEC